MVYESIQKALQFYGLYILLICIYEVFLEFRSKDKTLNFKMSASNLIIMTFYQFKKVLVFPLILLYGALLSSTMSWHFTWSTENWWHWLAALLLTDLAFYVYHYFAHNVNIIWGCHTVHHQSTDFNLSVAGRDGFLEPVFRLTGVLPLALIGLPPLMAFTCTFFSGAYMVFLHTQYIGKLGFLEYIFNTPSQHRIHHARNISQLGSTKNFGGIFCIWDRMFGTFHKEVLPVREYGIVEAAPIYSPIASQTYFYKHLYKQFWKAPWRDRSKILFTNYNPDPLPAFVSDNLSDKPISKKTVIVSMVAICIIWNSLLISLGQISHYMKVIKSWPQPSALIGILFYLLTALYAVSFVSKMTQGKKYNSFYGYFSIMALLATTFVQGKFSYDSLIFSRIMLLLTAIPFLAFGATKMFVPKENASKPTGT